MANSSDQRATCDEVDPNQPENLRNLEKRMRVAKYVSNLHRPCCRIPYLKQK